MIRGHISGSVLCNYCATLVPHSAWKLNSFSHRNKHAANNCLETRAWQPFYFKTFDVIFFLAVVSASVHFTAHKHETARYENAKLLGTNEGNLKPQLQKSAECLELCWLRFAEIKNR